MDRSPIIIEAIKSFVFLEEKKGKILIEIKEFQASWKFFIE